MNENEPNHAVERTAIQPLYSHPYYAKDGKLYIEKQSRSGPYLEQLCNFTPRIVSEVTFDDAQTVRKEYRIGGEDEYGNPLPEVDVAADDLSKMDWLANHWPATLRLSVVSSVEKHVQCAMKETAVYVPDIGESGTARTFIIEMQPRSINLPLLTDIQTLAADGMLMRCMYGYIEWLKETYLSTDETVQNFVSALKQKYVSLRTAYREELQQRKIVFHDRLPDTLTCLHIGFDMLLRFLVYREMLKEDAVKEQREKFRSILLAHAAKQSDAVVTDKPTHIFIRKLFAMIECGQASLVKKDSGSAVAPGNFLGYEDDDYCYIFFEASHKAVSKFCADQNEVFTITSKALAKQLADEELIEVTDSGKNTRSLPFGGVNKRVMLLKKSAVKDILNGI